MFDENLERLAKIAVVGVGGAGGNAINRMMEAQVRGVKFVAINTDAQVLSRCKAETKLQIGQSITGGLGAGADPSIGEQAGEEGRQEISKILQGCDMVFITAGMGKGTGTGASPIIGQAAKEIGALTLGVVTKPFAFEGPRRTETAEKGIVNLRESVDTLIAIPNERLLTVAERKTPIIDAFRLADETLRQGVQGISDIIVIPGEINLDFADVRTVMTNAGTALMGLGEASGDDRAIQAAHAAISSPLLETPIQGANHVLLNITGGPDMSLSEAYEAAQAVAEAVDNDIDDLLFGVVLDEQLHDVIRVTVIATGVDVGPGARPARGKRAAPGIEELDASLKHLAESLPPGAEEEPELPAFLRKEGFQSE